MCSVEGERFIEMGSSIGGHLFLEKIQDEFFKGSLLVGDRSLFWFKII